MQAVKKIYKELGLVKGLCGYDCLSRYAFKVIANAPAVVRNRSLIPADRSMSGRTLSISVFGQVIKLDGGLIGAARELYGRKVYFAHPGFLLRPEDVVVDLGANAGVFTTLAARLAKKVVAVEAQSGFVKIIRANLALNNCGHKAAVEFGIVGPGTGVLSDEGALRSASHYEAAPPRLTMSGLLKSHNIEFVNFLKVDIEGSEFDLFFNDNDWLSRVEKIAMEVHSRFGDPAQLSSVLEAYGFDVRLVDNDQQLVNSLNGTSGYLFAHR